MTTMYTSRLDRPKKVVRYGKSSSRSSYSTKHVDSWIEDDARVSQPVPSRPTVKETYPVNKRETAARAVDKADVAVEAKKATLKRVTAQDTRRDAWDVPSDDEVREDFELRRPALPTLKSSRKLVNDNMLQQETLAPWERGVKQQKRAADYSAGTRKSIASGPEQSNKPEQSPPNVVSYISPSINERQPISESSLPAPRRRQPARLDEPQRQESAKSPPVAAKRAGAMDDAHRSTKRARKSPAPVLTPKDVAMDTPACALAVDTAPKGQSDIFDFPAHEDGEPTLPSVIAPTPKPSTKNPRRGKLVSARRPRTVKGSSAPARLSDMLPVDTDSTDTPSLSPSVMASPPSTPARGMTPARSPSSQHSASKIMTPKQAQLWNQLLPSDPPAPTPSDLAIQNQSLAGRRKPAVAVAPPKLTLARSVSDVPELHRRRTRLVDRLKAAASSSDAESSDDSDIEMEDDRNEEATTQQTTTIPSKDEPASQSQLPTQSQSQGAARVTYARARSYFQEDSLDDVLFNLQPAETPFRPQTFQRQPSKTGASQSQKSAFDLEDSDDEQSRSGLRTIHELRAAGRNDRFTQDTAALLEDIADHVVSARPRRRSALTELALKLGDKAYVEQFVSQGFEHNLVAELSAPADQIADAALAAAIATLLASEPQQHIIPTIADAGMVDWAAKLLSFRISLANMSKDRKFNMSKASQSDLAKSAEKMRMSTVLWEQTPPSTLSPRFIALRLFDLLLSALRKSGDHSDIVDESGLRGIVSNVQSADVDSAERGLIISVLESLSTSAPSLNWPVPVVEAVTAAVQGAMQTESQTAADRHTAFLAFRLTLNLTNNNARNCTYFASDELVANLIVTIKDGFNSLNDTTTDAEHRAINMDLLVLAMGIMINLAEHCPAARQHAISKTAQPSMAALLDIFTAAQEGLEEAESLDASQTNVAFGYLAVMLANLCMDNDVREFICERLPGKNLDLLVSAVEEFVRHHQRVDALGLGMDGVEGREVWGAFTEKLKAVLGRLKIVAGQQ
ncbi:hypothetical protein EJ03DRAFT_193921 [Teratosphaeria nubilosa]|uniref:Wings apart-like protein C-terminal domain-containing protein n=1 Tax=Teratosphaeria nubilosa TaxID=161662 RepID=A0A6G1KZE4_9PEZI|nr:hypothetical protein EJ03DRAFT_193921 [Teratosphaeria nubilosa]